MNAPIPGSTPPGLRALAASLRSPGESLTLDRLRSDLSHDTAAKIARLAGLVQEWRAGKFQPRDRADATAILLDLERIFLRHARTAGARFRTFSRLTRLLGLTGAARRELAFGKQGQLTDRLAERLAGLISRIRLESRALVETLSDRHAARLTDLARAAVEEINRESGSGDLKGPTVSLEGAEHGAGLWLPRRDAADWADVLRNLIRNAVQATEDRRAHGGPRGPGSVTVRLRPAAPAAGVTLEILDEGVGMTPAQVEGMWRTGRGTHGPRHGQGLTESKREFVAARAALEVRSVPDVGTCVRIDLPHRDVPVRPPRLWAMPPLAVPAALLLAGAAMSTPLLLEPPIVSVNVDATHRTVYARDAHGALLWQRVMDEEVLPNWRAYMVGPKGRIELAERELVLPGAWPAGATVVLATQPLEGPARLWRLGGRGEVEWLRTLHWIPPGHPHAGKLKALFTVPTWWNRPARAALAVNVRDSDYSSTAIQFFSPDGDSLGAYYHPGQVEFQASGDFDGDGRTEVLLRVINNGVSDDPALCPPGIKGYVCGLALLEPPSVSGQGFPYSNWPGMPRAREKGYVLIPPLRRDLPLQIAVVNVGRPTDLVVDDGRIYHLDAHLRPISCGVGDFTKADSLAPTRALAPVLYIHDGRLERIDLPVRKGTE